MITFGFRNRMSGVFRAVAAIVLGIIMVAMPSASLRILVQIVAAVLIASGLVSAVYGLANRRNGAFSLMIFNSVVDVVLGVLMFCYPDFVAGFIIVVLGVALLLLGLLQIFTLVSASSFVRMGFWAYLFPVLCTAGGALIIFRPWNIGSALTLVAGIALLVYGVSELIASWKMRKAMKEYEIKFGEGAGAESGKDSPGDAFGDAVDVQYEKVEDSDKDDTAGDSRQDN